MRKSKYLAFDTETGGLNPLKNPILTAFFGIIGEDFGLIDELNLYIRPEAPFDTVEPDALAINKIDLSEHLESPRTVSLTEAKGQLLNFLKKHKGAKMADRLRPMGYNIDFDLGMVWAQLLPPTDWNANVHYAKMDPKTIVDFLKESGWLPPEIGKLESLAKHFNISTLGAHECRSDTLMMVESYKRLIDMLKDRKNDSLSFDILSMLEK